MSGILNIAMSGLNDATLRASNAASNIANAFSTSALPTTGGTYTGFQPQDVVSLSTAGGGTGGVTSTLKARSPAYEAAPGTGSAVANAHGLVATPNVDLTTEMVALQTAQVSYGANATLIRSSDQMQKRLLDAVS